MASETSVDKSGLFKTVSGYMKPEDVALVERACACAEGLHDGQTRKSGEPYIMHPVEVAKILAGLEADGATVAAALLHDVLEDCHIEPDDLKKQFGSEVCRLVEGVTKLGKISFSSKEERQAENFRRMFLAMGKDIRVILLKLADRLHNMRTLAHMKPDKQQEIARETLEIFAPLAHRLGLGRIKAELEDWSLRYLHPDAYYRLSQLVAAKREEREAIIARIVGDLQGELGKLGVTCKLSGRPKHFYSIWQKMTSQNKEFTDLYDITAVRVLVDSLKECYETLGVVHSLWKPIPGRFKDYIAMPKSNLYQSLHTAVIGPKGSPVEIQIRTFEMHRVAEYGIAAHWRYKEGGKELSDLDTKLTWLRQMLDWQNDLKDANEYLTTVKEDLFADEVFVFSPRGDVIDLPRDATPLDFAYRIHTDVGHRCVGAKVNGRIVPLDTHLANGDIVEVITSKKPSPSRDWLKIVATTSAKNRIRQWYKKEHRDENIALGREALEREVGRNGLEQLLRSDRALETAQKFNCPTVDDLLAAIGYGELGVMQVLNRLRPEPTAPALPPEAPREVLRDRNGARGKNAILIDGSDSMLVNMARCCMPLPGEAVRGAVTRGRGITVHAADCMNLAQVDPDRTVAVEWAQAASGATYPVEIEIELIDRVGLLKDVSAKIADAKTNIRAARIRTLKNKAALISLVVDISDTAHLQRVLSTVGKMSDVIRANRVTKLRQGPSPGASR
ncbi:MAG: bifunctional (p)ppGpp synthetase/guanosine-3',5'-bis(diphosphate) 3'-pyrophosphohydrolase [Candidatus Sericytochromatia bacterium]|nr:bifunctional (p)ppGpp synthetase/guanosine-3',5'-bis(diphosphate) 3'-pyrophosphohydrolase [Candidatus Sericytochromatia bacterium]MEB3221368.1 bifunctional (p)ppGpp synthetase/guanosine-3',5'-bis(diphosphate) 3'-pyrophosphohydrolase [Candidatus Sericytochromatia bacterium]